MSTASSLVDLIRTAERELDFPRIEQDHIDATGGEFLHIGGSRLALGAGEGGLHRREIVEMQRRDETNT